MEEKNPVEELLHSLDYIANMDVSGANPRQYAERAVSAARVALEAYSKAVLASRATTPSPTVVLVNGTRIEISTPPSAVKDY